MIRKIIQIISFLLWATPNHFMSLYYLSNNHLLTTSASSSFVVDALEMKWSGRHVDTKLGVVQGFILHPNGFESVEVFLNMPYASPPVGSLRFMPPVSGSPWSGVRKSDKPSPVCPQALPDIRNETEALKMMPRGRLTRLKRLLPHLLNQNEDCLKLNVYQRYVPESISGVSEKLAVLVFIHGDDYAWGAGHPFDPTMLVSVENIIVVTLNYRLGILGFLNANSDSHFRLPYNFALLDQIAALQWIQENIGAFGGDSKNVTLMGYGKGATLVNFLMISNAVPTGLFHRAILSSGSALSPLSSDLSKGPELSKRFAKRVRCPPEPSSTMLECLREVPVKQFLDSELWSLFGPSGDGIVVKNELPSENVIINRISHYPLLFGVVKAEALPELSNHDATYGMENERRRELLKQFITKYYRFHRNEILAGAIHEYTDWEKPAQHPLNVREETLEALADAQVVAPLTKIGDLHSQSSRSRAYFYVFDYQSKFSDYQQRLGCVHTEDLLYMFGVPLYFYENDSTQTEMMRSDISASSSTRSDDSYNSFKSIPTTIKKEKTLGIFTGNFTWNEVQLSRTVMRLFANFIRIGNPNGDLKSQLKGEQFLQPQGKVNGPRDTSSGNANRERVRDAGTGGSYHTNSRGSSRNGNNGSSNAGSSSNTRLTTDDNRLLGRENLEKHHLKQQEQMPEPILVEWPQYESLDKKYLVLDLRPRQRVNYRAHKLSFWLHLVPDYQKNDEGTFLTGIHHGINSFEINNSNNISSVGGGGGGSVKKEENLSKVSVIPSPTVYVSGMYELSLGGSNAILGKTQPHNSSGSSNSPKLSPILPGAIDPSQTYPKEQQDSGESSNINGEESIFGFQTYSTALSVTIAIGCSLLILNILIFATFYYEREKRLNALRRSTSFQQEQTSHPAAVSNPNQTSYDSPRVQTCVSISSTSNSLKRRKENGGLGIIGRASGSVIGIGGGTVFGGSVSGIYDEHRNSSSFENLHLATFVDEVEPFVSCTNTNIAYASSSGQHLLTSSRNNMTMDEINYENHPIKRYYHSQSQSSNPSGQRICNEFFCSTPSRSNRPTHQIKRGINEHPDPMSIDMSDRVTNDTNFSSQSSSHRRTLQIGSTFVGIEPSCSYLQDHSNHHYQNSPCRQDLQDNSSIDDGQCSGGGSTSQ